MKLVHFPHPSLLTISKPVTEFNSDLEIISSQMIELMHQSSGVGLAANQVALNKRIFVMQCDNAKPAYVFINPEIISNDNELEKNTEGCLSFPGLSLEISRQKKITLKWQDIKGNVLTENFNGLEAVCIQHETDHLNGINFIEKLGNVKKMMAMKKYQSFRNKLKN